MDKQKSKINDKLVMVSATSDQKLIHDFRKTSKDKKDKQLKIKGL